jgi:hypothetical protein
MTDPIGCGHRCTSGLDMGRRGLMLGLGAALAMGAPAPARAAGGSAKLVVFNLRGGLDGLACVAPYGDRNLSILRSALMAPAVGMPGGMLHCIRRARLPWCMRWGTSSSPAAISTGRIVCKAGRPHC